MQPVVGKWTCLNGHLNFGGSSCPSCGGQPSLPDGGGGVNPIILFSWIGLIFAAPVYPFAGGAAFIGALATTRTGAFIEIHALLLLPLVAAATMGSFYAGYLVEERVSAFRPYRILRDIIRFAVGVLIILKLGSDTRAEPIPSGDIVGMIIVFPLILLVLRRLDIALKLAGPENDPDSPAYKEKAPIIPAWLREAGAKASFPLALTLGALGGVVGFALGGVLAGLIVWVAITLAVVVFTGGFAIVSTIDEKLGGLLFKIAVGVPLGALVAAFVMHTPDGRPLPEAGPGAKTSRPLQCTQMYAICSKFGVGVISYQS